MQSLFAHVISERERERENHVKQKKKKKKNLSHMHMFLHARAISQRERDPYPREITYFSLKMPPFRDTTPYFIKRRASNMHSLVSYT